MQNNYVQYLKSITTQKTLNRKKQYIKYNFGKIISETTSNAKKIKILEIGPGLGEFVEYCIDTFENFKIDVLDNDKSVLNYIKKKYSVRKTFHINKDISEIDDKLNKYNVIMVTQVLEHIPLKQQQHFISTLFEHLQDGGVMIITVPNMANPFTSCERYADITHTTGFTDNSLLEIARISLNKETTENISVQAFRIPPSSFINILRIFLQKILHICILLLSIINAGSYSKILTPNITLVIKK